MEYHELKILPKYLVDIRDGYKDFEIRINDRDYQEGDTLVLHGYENGAYTGEQILVHVLAVLKDYPGVKENYVVMYIERAY
jgi:ASC-1-like (ASCH) protein